MLFLDTQFMASAILVTVIILAIWLLKSMLAPLVLAVIVAVLVYPLYRRLLARLKQNKNLSAFLVTAMVLIFVLLPLFSLGTVLIQELQSLYQLINNAIAGTGPSQATSIIQSVSEWAVQYGINIEQVLRTYILPGISKTSLILSAVAANVIGVMFGFIIAITTLFFLLRDGDGLVDFLHKISPLSEQNTKYFFATCKNVIQSVLWANLLTACAQGIIGGIGFALFGLPAPVFWGVVMFGFSLIPFFGPAFIYGPTTLFLFLSTRNIQLALLYLGYNVLIVSTIDNIIKPLVIGSKVKIHPIIMFLSIIGGLRAWGVLGIIYGPLVVSLLLLIIDIHLREVKQRSLFE